MSAIITDRDRKSTSTIARRDLQLVQYEWMTTKEAFGARFKEAINGRFPEWDDKGKGQVYAAKKLSIQQSTVSDYINGKKMPAMDTACELSVALNVSLEWLMTGRGPKQVPPPPQDDVLIRKVSMLNEEHRRFVTRLVDSILTDEDEEALRKSDLQTVPAPSETIANEA